MTHSMTLSICQFPISFLDWKKNSQKALLYIRAAKASGSNLILFPEMYLTGISHITSEMGDSHEKNLKFFQQTAMDHSIAIGFGWARPAGEKLENHYTVVNPQGEILSDYVKLHPFTFGGEDLCFVKGKDFKCFSYHGFTICTFICYDMRFPEIFQAASRTADLIIVAANWPEKRSSHWKVLSQARAIENQVYLAACNCVGTINSLSYSGDSALYSPDGIKLGSLSHTDGLITCTIANNVSSIRKDFPVKNDRLTDYYKKIL